MNCTIICSGIAAAAEQLAPAKLTIPSGFAIEMAAEPPLVKHPMMACLDERGRLFVAESAGVNRTAPELLAAPPHKILMLEDTNGDGRYDKSTVFADGLAEPNGALWHDGALYVCAAPYLWRFEDTDGDGQADKRQRILGKFNFVGMSDSMHGPELGPDGRLYWCGGQHGWNLQHIMADRGRTAPTQEQLKEQPHNEEIAGKWTSTAPGVFACDLDGSQAEAIGFGGVCNPVEVAFTRAGEALGTVAVYDMFEGRHDALLHWIKGGVFNLREDNYAYVQTTGDVLTPVSRRGHVAPAGLTRYSSNQFGSEYRDNLFLCEFNTHRVYRVQLARSGATYTCRDEVFVESSSTDTHFTDVFEDADGSLLVIDTGGWFLRGCPTSQIEKPELLGRIYRIRKQGAPAIKDPRGQDVAWSSLQFRAADLLDDPRPVVRERAVAAVAKAGARSSEALLQLLDQNRPSAVLNAVWAICRSADYAALKPVLYRILEQELDPDTAIAVLHTIGLHRDLDFLIPTELLLKHSDPAVRRQAATALGQLRQPHAVPHLLAACAENNDRFLEHALIDALIRIGDTRATSIGLANTSSNVRRCAVIALDRSTANLDRTLVAPLMTTDDQTFQEALLAIASRRGWDDLARSLLARWLGEPYVARRAPLIKQTLSQLERSPHIQAAMATALADEKTAQEWRLLILKVIAGSGLKSLPAELVSALSRLSRATNPALAYEAITTVNATGSRQFDGALENIAAGADGASNIRVAAAAVVVPRLKSINDSLFAFLLARAAAEVEPIERLAAARTLAVAPLSSAQLARLLPLVAQAGPLELPPLLHAFDRVEFAQLGKELVAAIEKSPGSSNLNAAQFNALLDRYPPSVRHSAKVLLDRLNPDAAAQRARLAELAPLLEGGDLREGKKVFFGQQASCGACHRVGDRGETIGPNLSQIGQIRTRRDLLEAVVFPSASFARGFEPVNVITTDGKTFSGIIGRESVDAIYLRTSDRQEIRIAREDVDEMAPAKISIMPQGLERTLSPEQLRNLLAYLSAQRTASKVQVSSAGP